MQASDVVKREATPLASIKAVLTTYKRQQDQFQKTSASKDTREAYLEGVKNTTRDHVGVLSLGGVVTPVELVTVLLQNRSHDNGTLLSSVFDDSSNGLGKSGADDRDT